MGVSTLQASNIKGFAFEFANLCARVQCGLGPTLAKRTCFTDMSQFVPSRSSAFAFCFYPHFIFGFADFFFFFLLCLKCVTDHSLQVFRQALRWFVSVTALIPFLPAFLRETGISEDMFLFLHKMGIFGWLIV